MRVVDVYWHEFVNRIVVICDECDLRFVRPANFSLVKCNGCGRIEMWHGVQPHIAGNFFGAPVMTMEVK